MTQQSGGSSYPGVSSGGVGKLLLDAVTLSGTGGVSNLTPGSIIISRSDDVRVLFQAVLASGSSGTEILLEDSLGSVLLEWDADGSLLLASGIGLHGVPAQAAPRTLAQATITAITDASAQTAVQALANALSDIGALVLT